MNRIFLFLLTVCSLFLLAGCLAGEQGSLPHQLKTEKQAPVVYIYPESGDNYRQGKVGILSFQVPTQVESSYGLGVANLFKDVMLGKQAFATVTMLPAAFGSNDEALSIGRKEGVDLVLAGRLNYAMTGTELGGSRIDVSMRLLNVHTGNTVWYVQQAMYQPMPYADLSFAGRMQTAFSLPQSRRLLDTPSVPDMLVRIAEDMADVMAGARRVPE